MISAERFARERTSYWQQLLPRLEPFVRLANLSVGRFSPPLPASVTPNRRSFVAELGFELFRRAGEFPIDDAAIVSSAAKTVQAEIARLSGRAEDEVDAPSADERSQATALANRLREFVDQRGALSYVVDPPLPGCGIIDSATGDLLIERSRFPFDDDQLLGLEPLLYEVKTVTRAFRAIDIRQLVTYAALMASSGNAPVTLGIVNPLLGTFVEFPTDRLADDIAGVNANRLLQQIIFDVSAAEVSL